MIAKEIMKTYPQDVVIHIVLRFPVKFLIRLKCVSETFYTLIQSSTFINLHLNHATTLTHDNILFKRSIKEDIGRHKAIFSILSNDGDNYLKIIYPNLDVPYRTSRRSITTDKVLGPFHGLIAVIRTKTAIIINPSTRNYRFLPSSPCDVPKGFRQFFQCGWFGFDSVINDFKLFRIYQVYRVDLHGYHKVGGKKVEVYELSIDIWRELDDVDQQLPNIYWCTSSIFYKGAYHWITTSEEDDKTIIDCFDMSTEIFRNVKPPATHQFSNGKLYSLLNLNKSLCMTCYPLSKSTQDFIEIWIMKDYNIYESWIKKYSITGISIQQPLVVWKDYLFIFQSYGGYLMSYDLNFDEIKGLDDIHGCLYSMRAIIFKESLTPIPRGIQSSTQFQNF